MVFYFEGAGGLELYMGKDQFENDELIRHGWPEDVWFHVDGLSSAHVYARLPRGPVRAAFRETGTLEHLPEAVRECCALVKGNSIEGSKRAEVVVVYTAWENLRKEASMDPGQVGFHDQRKVVRLRGVQKDRDLVKRLEKTQREDFPDLAAQRARRDAEVAAKQKAKQREARKQAALDEDQRRKDKEERSYDRLFANATAAARREATVDASAALEAEEDFM